MTTNCDYEVEIIGTDPNYAGCQKTIKLTRKFEDREEEIGFSQIPFSQEKTVRDFGQLLYENRDRVKKIKLELIAK